MPRTAHIQRTTGETQIDLAIDLDGIGRASIATGVGFFDHMLTLLARHSLIDLTIKAAGDLHVEAHHTVEDVGICLGKALTQALGDKAGIRRYGDATVPMDETLVTAAVDLCGRPFCVWKADVPLETLGAFSSQLAEEFWRLSRRRGRSRCMWCCTTARTRTTSSRASSRRRREPCARPSRPIRVPPVFPPQRECCEPPWFFPVFEVRQC